MPDIFVSPDEEKKSHQPVPAEADVSKHPPRPQQLTKKTNEEYAPQTATPIPTNTSKSTSLSPHAVSFLSSFTEGPTNVSFQNQEDDERIFLFMRRHLITNLPWIMTAVFFGLLPLLLGILTNVLGLTFFFPFEFSASYTTVFLLFYYLLVATYAFINFITWFYNISIVTQKRIIDIDYSHLVYHNMAITKVDLVEEVKYTQNGFFRSFFDYGDVFVHTAGKHDNFEFLAVPHPSKATDVIEELIGGERTHGGA